MNKYKLFHSENIILVDDTSLLGVKKQSIIFVVNRILMPPSQETTQNSTTFIKNNHDAVRT